MSKLRLVLWSALLAEVVTMAALALIFNQFWSNAVTPRQIHGTSEVINSTRSAIIWASNVGPHQSADTPQPPTAYRRPSLRLIDVMGGLALVVSLLLWWVHKRVQRYEAETLATQPTEPPDWQPQLFLQD